MVVENSISKLDLIHKMCQEEMGVWQGRENRRFVENDIPACFGKHYDEQECRALVGGEEKYPCIIARACQAYMVNSKRDDSLTTVKVKEKEVAAAKEPEEPGVIRKRSVEKKKAVKSGRGETRDKLVEFLGTKPTLKQVEEFAKEHGKGSVRQAIYRMKKRGEIVEKDGTLIFSMSAKVDLPIAKSKKEKASLVKPKKEKVPRGPSLLKKTILGLLQTGTTSEELNQVAKQFGSKGRQLRNILAELRKDGALVEDVSGAMSIKKGGSENGN